MLGKSITPVIGKLAGKSIPPPLHDGSTSPRSPFELKSPKCPKSFDLGVVGLAIVAALDESPVSRNSIKIPARFAGDSEEDEEYTLVTCRGPDNESYTKLYCDGGVICSSRKSIFEISPASSGESPACPDSDFLDSCYMCRKNLHGRDIYMCRGEISFCSAECRERKMMMDEYSEKMKPQQSSEIPRSVVDVSSSLSSTKNGQMFSILAL